MSDQSSTARLVSRCLAALAGLLAVATLVGYALRRPDLISVRAGLQGMSPLTATAIVALAVAVLGLCARRRGVARAGASVAALVAVAALASHAIAGADKLSGVVVDALFDVPPGSIGRTSVATALSALLIAAATWFRRGRPLLADSLAGAALVVTGTALLGYAYGVEALYALPMFNTMALNTASALFALAAGTMLAEPDTGWTGVITSQRQARTFTRCLLAFALMPPLAGYLLVELTRAGAIGFSAAMALLVVVTVVPLAVLILRAGRAGIALDAERRRRIDLQAAHAATLEKTLAAKVAELEHEVAERAKTELAMHRAQRLEAIGQLTGGIAHDFNNLLQALSGNVSLLQRRIPEGDPSRKFVDNAGKAVQKGAKLTAQLLAFSRSQRLTIRPVLVRAAMQDAHELIRHSIGPDIALAVDMPAEDTWVQGDANQLELALVNLAMNARDAMPAGGSLHIASREVEAVAGSPRVAISVVDTGTGMTPEVANRAGEPFFTTKPQGKGTGLGLAQVYGFVRQCGGDLAIRSAPGQGTTVEILLPRTRPEAPPAAGPAVADPGAHAAVRSRSQVLVVDDDESVRSVIVQGLVDAGYDVVQAEDGPRGLSRLEAAPPAVMVIDFLMPGMNGAEVARRAQARCPGLPIVFVSGYSDTLALDGIAGAVVLRKPFDLDGLRGAVAAALR